MLTYFPKSKGIHSIYIHVPFCHNICAYCDFKRVKYHKEWVNQWLIQINKEYQAYHHELEVSQLVSLYIGGGTPSCLTHPQLNTLLQPLLPYINSCKEVTMEVNPEDINEDNVRFWKSLGINRLSIGVESMDPCMLKRMHRSNEVLKLNDLFQCIRNNGIFNISIDLMYGLPNQSLNDYQDTLQTVIHANPTHISAYCLTIEENSLWAKQRIKEVEDELAGLMMELTDNVLNKYGYQRYEVSNYCLKGYESQHNLTYWHYDDFLAFGYGSSGKVNHQRYDHCDSLSNYLKPNGYQRVMINESIDDIYTDYLMMNLRLKEPFIFNQVNELFNIDFFTVNKSKLEVLRNKNYLSYDNNKLIMTNHGLNCLFDVLVTLDSD